MAAAFRVVAIFGARRDRLARTDERTGFPIRRMSH